jgi:hypothetical protein
MIFVALLGSAVINLIWLTLDAITTGAKHSSPILARLVDRLGSPGRIVADAISPSGHSVFSIMSGVAIALMASVVAYAIVVWIGLELLSLLRDTLRNKR